MVAMKLAAIAVLATVAVAAPTTAVTTAKEVKPFSWSQWVADLLNPDVVALTPEQAVEAYYQSINATASTHDGAVKTKRLNRICLTDDAVRADVNAATKCVSSLAALGTNANYNLGAEGSHGLTLCTQFPGVQFTVSSYYLTSQAITAADLAVGGGHIMDGCTWGGKAGGSVWEETRPLIQMDLWKH